MGYKSRKLFTQTKIASKTKSNINELTNKPNGTLGKRKYNKNNPKQPPNKCSTLDDWLKKLYRTHSQITQVVPNEKNVKINGEECELAVASSAPVAVELSRKLVIKLEKVDTPMPHNNISSQNDEQDKKPDLELVKRKQKLHFYKDRSSEYIRTDHRQYKCAKCDVSRSTLIAIRTHFDKEHNTNTYKCKLCPFETPLEYCYNNHVRCHSKTNKECPYCKKTIKWFSYKTHIKTHERNDQTEYKCIECDYRSYNHSNVKRHMISRHKNQNDLKTFSCDSCDYVTIFDDRLKHHKKMVHSKEGAWKMCFHCDYTTRNNAHLSRHISHRHAEKMIHCDQCPRRFASKDNLRYHIQRKHTDQSSRKYYYCDMCPKEQQYRTTIKGNLARHVLAHRTLDEVELFACHKCPYLCKSRNALKIHLINSHFPEMHSFKCKICGYSTGTKSRYNLHMRTVHGKPKQRKFELMENSDCEIEIK